MILAGYKIFRQIYESDNSIIYRGLKEQNNQPVILKVLKQDYPTPATLIRYKQEYEITQKLNIDGAIKVYSLEKFQTSLVMVLEDFGGESLRILMNAQKFSLNEFLKIAIATTHILGEIHRQNVIHKDINPANIVFNSTTQELKIIDFGISTILQHENSLIKNPNVLEGTLAYISPEQTGRMNRAIDYRTDFYSLGATFYELLTHKVPCNYADAIEVVHCHIAKQVVPPNEIDSTIPQAVSNIVMKLLAKTAEERYQSAWGILADLEECLQQLENKASITDFSIAQKDISDKFQIPQKLYGREGEVETLLAAFDRVSSGTTEIMLVSGYSGIGKSALVQEVYKPITKARGYFIAGKFDQFQRNIPYLAVVKAFQSLVKQLLTESETQLNDWKEKILGAVGANGQLIIDVIPEVELIVGKQPPVQELGATEAPNRFNLVFQKFIRVFCSVEHPLVIFLDDLQWADSATLKLLQVMMADEETKYLFLIGAYRDNEVNPTHPLIMALEGLQKQGTTINQITLTPLDIEHIGNLIADTVRRDIGSIMPLADLVVGKTQGNPFFVNQFLKTLYEEKLLNFNSQQRDWNWDISKIEAVDITDNVVELLVTKIQRLQPSTQDGLRRAACIGNQFDLQTLAFVLHSADVLQKPDAVVAIALLKEAVIAGLILPLNDVYKRIELGISQPGDALRVEYQFAHDRIQQAAYSLNSDVERLLIHRQIGELLLHNMSPEQQNQKLFDIVNHLNLSQELIDTRSDRDELARLNLLAGGKAKASIAYDAAFRYFQAGLSLLTTDSWQINYDLTLTLYSATAEAAFLCGDFKQVEQLSQCVIDQAKNLLDSVKVYDVRIQTRVAQSELLDAIDIGLQFLKKLGVDLPRHPTPEDVQQALSEIEAKLANRPIEDLIDLPVMSDLKVLAAMQLLTSMCAAAFLAVPPLFLLVVLKMVELLVDYGNMMLSPFAYAAYGLILSGVVVEIESGYQFGQLALKLLTRLEARSIEARTLFPVNNQINVWKNHLRESIKPLQECYQVGLDYGDLEFAGYAAMHFCGYSFAVGQPLSELQQHLVNYAQAVERIKHSASERFIRICWQTVLNLAEPTPCPVMLSGKAYDETTQFAQMEQTNFHGGLFYFYLNKLFLSYLFQDENQAIAYAAQAEKYLAGMTGAALVAIFRFYDSLAQLAIYATVSVTEQAEILEKVTVNQKMMQRWASHAPMNYLHKFYLVEAERHRVLWEKIEAIEMYDKAIALAKENEYIHEEALAHELAAKFYLSWGKETIAKVYMQNARYSYQAWGAITKVEDLEERYPQLIAKTSAKITSKIKINETESTATNTSSNLGEALDLATVMKAAQAISGEIVLGNLLERLMKIAIENAGAEKGFLILEKAGNWAIEAEGSVKGDEVSVLRSLPINSTTSDGEVPKLASAIANYVIRTQENVVLNNAAQEGQFTRDPYVAATQPKSILCTPLLHQGKMTGILYLENNLTEGAFTTDRLELLKLLSGQIAISIENAQLYKNLQEFNQNLEQLVSDRTQELSNALAHLKATQAKLVEAEKMASLGGLVAGIAHEINTPVGVGVTVASALVEQTSEFDTIYKSGKMKRSELEEFVDIATQSSNVLLINLNQAAQLIQSFKQVAVDQCSEDRRIFNVRDYLDEILLQLKPNLRNIKHTIEVTGDNDITLDSYPGALSQIVTNLLMNSIIHAYEPDTYGKIIVDFQQEDELFILEYSDDGLGIPPENLSKIYEPFFTTKRGQGGSGLGLHIVYNLVTQTLKGEIECISNLGSGTKFIIKLPRSIDTK
jgi:predicted ATPase/signal transduction histidine kinase/tRNA A-37 threonylcarbamoyl transferase component Bud32